MKAARRERSPPTKSPRIATGWRLCDLQPPLIINTSTQIPDQILVEKTIPEADLAKCRNLGAALGAGLKMGVY